MTESGFSQKAALWRGRASQAMDPRQRRCCEELAQYYTRLAELEGARWKPPERDPSRRS